MTTLFEKIKQWVVTYQAEIILFIGVVLISLLSFSLGFILAKQQEKEPIKIEGSRIFTNLSTNITNIRENSWDIRVNSREL